MDASTALFMIPLFVLIAALGGGFNGTRGCRRKCQHQNAFYRSLPRGDYRRLLYCECK